VVRAPLRITCLRCGHEALVQAEDDDVVLLDPLARRCPACDSDEVTSDGASGWQIHVDWVEDAV
jgi:Zn finger protein HypA/HybF involved in hydrogenase expression